ncbi:MAG: hypothetical protein HOL98_16820 [Gammaproteobacteria bacterium]|jgi:hypothetical protein|nr:hypothetical protein [Gammaproteobacteria bacterium]MBT5205125.1 hypothetical protein [Gammaproteobacteria bacterium]MBT5601990.1 hypothetical protein [Gammaproteobacteria bacterium]MBT6243960.1 hypothetical protein [Gammaproteobacteria bacterium]
MESSWKEITFGLLLCLVIPQVFSASLLECAAIEDVDTRLECYDKMADRVQIKIIEVEEVRATTEVKKALRQEVLETVIAMEPEVDEIKIVDIYRNKIMRVTYIAEDGRRFSKGSTTPSQFRKGDLVRLEKGFMGAKILVRADGLRIKVKEISAN